ncbi:MAG: hypothetical protein R3C53_07935 [Pirellulaceae bacterium]
MIDLLPVYTELSKEFDDVDSSWLLCHQVEALIDLGAKLDQKDFKVPVQSKAAVLTAADSYRSRLAVLHEELRPLEDAFERRVVAVGELLQTPALRGELGAEADELAQRLGMVCQTLVQVQAAYRELAGTRNRMAALGLILRLVGGQDVDQSIAQNINDRIGTLATEVRATSDRFQGVFFPFEHADGALTMAQYLVPKIPAPGDFGGSVQAVEKLLENYFYVYFRSIGTLALICSRVEEALGWPPQADPEPILDQDE